VAVRTMLQGVTSTLDNRRNIHFYSQVETLRIEWIASKTEITW